MPAASQGPKGRSAGGPRNASNIMIIMRFSKSAPRWRYIPVYTSGSPSRGFKRKADSAARTSRARPDRRRLTPHPKGARGRARDFRVRAARYHFTLIFMVCGTTQIASPRSLNLLAFSENDLVELPFSHGTSPSPGARLAKAPRTLTSAAKVALRRLRAAVSPLESAEESLSFGNPTFRVNRKAFAVIDRYPWEAYRQMSGNPADRDRGS
jgi:hypothetical protein